MIEHESVNDGIPGSTENENKDVDGYIPGPMGNKSEGGYSGIWVDVNKGVDGYVPGPTGNKGVDGYVPGPNGYIPGPIGNKGTGKDSGKVSMTSEQIIKLFDDMFDKL